MGSMFRPCFSVFYCTVFAIVLAFNCNFGNILLLMQPCFYNVVVYQVLSWVLLLFVCILGNSLCELV